MLIITKLVECDVIIVVRWVTSVTIVLFPRCARHAIRVGTRDILVEIGNFDTLLLFNGSNFFQ